MSGRPGCCIAMTMTNYTNTWYIYIHICMQNHNDTTIIKTNDTVLRKMYLSHYWKGCVWQGIGDRTELQHIDPHPYGHQRFFPVLQCCSTGGPGAQLSAGCCFLYSSISPTLLIPKIQSGVPRAPSAGCWLSLPHLVSKLVCSPN